MSKPIIGITSGFVKLTNFSEGDYAHKDYITSLTMAGAVPLILPIAPGSCTERYAELCDGFLLSGGCDVNPQFFNEDPTPGCGVFDTERDQAELQLVHESLKRGKPLFGICRGLQVINVALGGTLIQDIDSQLDHPIQHEQKVPRREGSHRVRLEKSTRLYQVLGEQETIIVNSLHHQSIDKIGAGLKVAAFSSDGIIEAIDMTEKGLMGVQWHPESMTAGGSDAMLGLFKHFVAACIEMKQANSGV
ncbi:gamma-glutamyl-gamma-aminobutyrate hydrolase family protein [Sporolactobacillus shoreicorticis]|uniref:Gamma-glutamyl-gamma-aminobutyrate hydrolase family protein n=1 Tax=Sporolactobacillus shoreicorticis TaxID=1923877 RepID=A0ABW5S526_9BACL|nr:gamma-glutamyl-gamma-aminobutyrate hydrolase family protein [Sporolactobacillus shoreicorticis]MCO7127540.1 gamma-glutamyl-gamma-aminobutyrate hydrolase family protein [Sporolactobacillus shoreicorticis]